MDEKEFRESINPGVQFVATDQITGIYSFLGALDWTEAWPFLCIALHVSLFIAVISLKNHSSAQGAMFIGMLLVVYMAEYVNEFLSRNHRVFTKHQYFDSNGLFISIVVSVPMLVNCMAILINWIWTSVQLLKAHGVQRAVVAAARKKDEQKDKSE